MIGLEYIIPATAFIGVFLFFWGISSMLGGSSPESLGARMQRYAGGQQTATPEAKKERKKGRREIDPFATLSGDVQDKRFSSRVQRDLARVCGILQTVQDRQPARLLLHRPELHLPRRGPEFRVRLTCPKSERLPTRSGLRRSGSYSIPFASARPECFAPLLKPERTRRSASSGRSLVTSYRLRRKPMRRAGPGGEGEAFRPFIAAERPILDFDHFALLLLPDMKAEIVTHLDFALDEG